MPQNSFFYVVPVESIVEPFQAPEDLNLIENIPLFALKQTFVSYIISSKIFSLNPNAKENNTLRYACL